MNNDMPTFAILIVKHETQNLVSASSNEKSPLSDI